MPVTNATNSNVSTSIPRELFRRADAVCFDVDSTLIVEEGIDRLAEYCGTGPQVAEWTAKAMGGKVTFQEALKSRLSIINPTLQQLTDFNKLKEPVQLLTPGIAKLISLLHAKGTTVYLVSGGFRSLIYPLAEYLGIPKGNVYANRVLFNEDGECIGFDESEPTSRSGGKTKVIGQLKKKHNIVVMVGDGATDMEAYPPADTFIGFGGNVVRERVKAKAPWYIYKFQDLIDELQRQQDQESERIEVHEVVSSSEFRMERAPFTNGAHVDEVTVKAN